MQTAMEGLCHAALRFDPAKGSFAKLAQEQIGLFIKRYFEEKKRYENGGELQRAEAFRPGGRNFRAYYSLIDGELHSKYQK